MFTAAYARRVSVLVALANMTRDDACWRARGADDAHDADLLLARLVSSLVVVLEELRDTAEIDSGSGRSRERKGDTEDSRRSRLASWVSELHESVLRDMLAELECSAAAVAHSRGVLDGGACASFATRFSSRVSSSPIRTIESVFCSSDRTRATRLNY